MVSGEEGDHEALKFCLKGTRKELVSWGHEYLRCLAG
jgi:26S proteasome regulatory subunit N1